MSALEHIFQDRLFLRIGLTGNLAGKTWEASVRTRNVPGRVKRLFRRTNVRETTSA